MRRERFDIFLCRHCGSYAFGGPEEVVHLSNICIREPSKAVVERLTTVPILRERLPQAHHRAA